MKTVPISKITNNLDSRRVPLNSATRGTISQVKLYPYIGANNVLEYIDDFIFDEKILCIAEDGGSWGANEICAKIYNEKCWVNNHAHVLTAKSTLILEYLAAYLNYSNLNPYITGTTRGKLTRKKLDSIPVPLPPLDDQKRIAHLLGKVEGLIARRKQHLQQLDDLLKSVFLEMFGDPVRNEKGWETKTLPQLILPGKHSLKRGPFGGTLKKEIFVDSGFLVYEQYHALNNDYSFERYFITKEKYNELIDFKVQPNDILISCSGVYLGKLSIVPVGAKPGIINQALLKVSLDLTKINHIFFVYVFSSPQFKNKHFPSNRGGAIPNLPPMVEMKKIPFISPPIKLQTHFATIVEKVEGLKSRYQQSLTDLENLYGALSQKAFKGELDLSRVPLPTEATDMAEEEKINVEEKQPMKPVFELPAPEDLDELQTVEGRKDLINMWFNAWIENLGDKIFSVQHFMDAARQKLFELAEEEGKKHEEGKSKLFIEWIYESFDWGTMEYDELKVLVFEALEQGRLTQDYDDAKNRVQITAVMG